MMSDKALLRIMKSGPEPVWVVTAYMDGVWTTKETVSGKTREEAVAPVRDVLKANGFRDPKSKFRFVAIRL